MVLSRDRSDKSITFASNRFDIDRGIGIFTKRPSQPQDGCADALFEVYKLIIRPQSLSDAFPCNELSGMFKQEFQNLKGLLL
jgi:hypothetical protein